MTTHNSSSKYLILILTAVTLLAFFVMQAGAAYTTVTTPITHTVDTSKSGDIQILVSSDGNTISSDAGGNGIYAGSGGSVSIDKMSGGPDSLVINSGGGGVNVAGGTVSSDADLVIKSGADGVYNADGTVDLAGVSIDAKTNGIETQAGTTTLKAADGFANVISAGEVGINATGSGTKVLIAKDEGNSALTVNSGGNGIYAENDATVSSDANLIVKSANADGVYNNGGTVNLAGVSIDAASGYGTNAYAISNEGSGAISITTGDAGVELTASAVNGEAAAIGNSGTGKVTVATTGQVSFDVTGRNAVGLGSWNGGNITVSADKGSNYKVTSTNGDAYGIEADGASLDYGKVNNVIVEATGGNAYGLAAINGGTLSGDADSSIKNIIVTENTDGKTAYGVYASGNSTVNAGSIDAISVSSAGTGYGVLVERVLANDSSKLTAKIGAITVNASNDAYGLYAPSSTSKLDVTISGPVKVTAENGQAIGVYSASGGVTVSDDKAVITVASKGNNASAIKPDRGDITVKEADGVELTAKADTATATGVDVSTGKTVDIAAGGSVSADVTGASAYGFSATKGNAATDSLIKIEAGKDLAVKATGTSGTAAGFYASGSGAEITYKAAGALNISADAADGGAYGFKTENGGVISGSASGGTAVAIKSTGSNAYGIYAVGGLVSADLDTAVVTSTGGNAYGIEALGGLVNSNIGTAVVTSTGGNAYGIEASSSSAVSADLGSLSVTADNGAASGIYIESNTASSIDITGGLTVSGDGGTGITARGGAAHQITVNGLTDVSLRNGADETKAIHASYGAAISLNGGLSVDVTSSANAYGIHADDGSVTVSGGKSLSVTSTGGAAYGVYLVSGKASSVGLSADLTVSGNTGGEAIHTFNASDRVRVDGNLTASGVDYGVYSYGGDVDLAGVSIDAKTTGIDTEKGGVTTLKAENGYNTISAGGTGIYVFDGGSRAQIAKGSASSLSVMSGGDGVNNTGGAVSSDVNLAVKSGGNGVNNNGGTVDLAGVSIDAKTTGIDTENGGVTTLKAENGYNTISADRDGIHVSGGSRLQIAKGGASSLSITSGGEGVYVNFGGAVSSDANLIIKSGSNGVFSDSGGTADLAGVSIDAQTGIYTLNSGATTLKAEEGYNTISADSVGIHVATYSRAQIAKGSASSLSVTSGSDGIKVEANGVVSSNANLIIKSGSYGVYNDGSTVNLAGVSIDAVSAGANTYGVYARGGGNTTISGDKAAIKATTSGYGTNAYAISNEGSGAISITTGDAGVELTAKAASGDAAAIGNSGTGSVTVKTTGQASFDVTGRNAVGLGSGNGWNGWNGGNITVSADQGSNYKVTATNGKAYGIEADGASIDYGKVNNVIVEAKGGDAWGLAAINHGTLSGDANSAIKNITVTENTAGKKAYGILASGNSTVKAGAIDAISVSSAGAGYGVLVNDKSKLTAKIGAITVNASNDAYGLYAPSTESTLDVSISGPVKVTTENGKAIGVYSASGGVTVSDDQAVITATSKTGDASAITPDSGDITVKEASGVDLTAKTDEGTATGVNVGTGKTVDIATAGTVSADVTGASAYGFKAEKGNTAADSLIDIEAGKDLAVTATATNGTAAGLYASGDIAKITYKADGALDLNVSNTSGDAYGIRTANGGVISGEAANSGSVTVEATSGDAWGLAATNGGKLSGDANRAISNVTVTAKTAGKTAYGLFASGDAAINGTNIKQLTVNSAGSGAGIYANNSSVDVKADNVTVSASSALGVAADNSGSVSADFGSLSVTAKDGLAYGISVNSNKASSVAVAGGLTVKGANGGAGIELSDAAHHVTVGGLTDVTIKEDGDNAVAVDDGSTAVLNGGVSLDVTGKDEVNGVVAYDGSVSISGDKAVIRAATTGSDKTAYALRNIGSGDITINTGDEGVELAASSVNGAAQAIGNSGTGKVMVTTKGQVSFDVTGLTAKGIYNTTSQGEGVSVSADQGSNYAVTATNGDAYGIAADGVALDYGKVNNVAVTATNGNAYGLLADNGGTLSGDTASPIKSLTVTANTAGYNAYGILASGDKSQADFGTVDKLTVTANGASGDAYGVYAKNDGGISGTVSGDLTVTAAGNAYGIYAPDKNSSADITVKGAVTATSAAGEATGVYAAGGGVRLSGPEAVVKATSGANSDAVALYPKSNDITLNESGDITLTANSGSGGAAYGAKVPDSRRLDLATEKSVSIDVTGGTKGAYGLYAESGAASSDITATAAKGAIRISAKATGGGAAYGLVTSGDGASISLSAQTISVDAAGGAIKADGGSVTVSADSRGSLAATGENAAVIYAANGASIDLTNIDAAAGTSGMLVIGSGDSTISAKNSILSGDIKHSDLTLGGLNKTNVMTLSLLNDTTFTGKANSPRIDINIDNTSAWNVTGNSSTEGVLSNAGGTVSFVNDGTDNTSSYSKVTVSKLQGTGGKYLMHADLESGKGDQITADTSDVSGTIAIVSPVKKGAYRARMAEDLVRITGDKNSSFTLSGDTYEYGAWKYALASEDISGSGLGWYLSNTQKVSSVTTAVLGSVVAPNIGRLEEGALYSQLGSIDYASADRNEARAWGYAIYSKFKYTDASSAPYEGAIADDTYAENKYYGLTGGMDKLVNATETGSFYAGAMMGYGEGDLDISGGDADDNSFHAGVYGIYRYNSGLYLAGIAKYNRYRTNVTARPEEGGAYRADYNQDGWSVSALAGKRFDLKNNWYAEPQAEIGYQRIGSASYEIGGSDIAIDSTNSVRARLGVAVGRKVTTESGKTLDFYVKASVLREFDGETNISINGDPFKTDFGGTWGQYKLGIDYWNADNFGARAAIVYENGEGYESPIGFELSLNWYTGPKQQKAETEETAPQEETKAETEAPAAKTE